MEHPKVVGDRSTLAVMLALRAHGFEVLVPFGENTRYDLVIDDGARLARVQCKTGRLRTGAVRFNACSTYGHHRNPATAARDYIGQVDYFAVYCPETAGVYLIPIEDAAVKVKGALRVDPARNKQERGIRRASNYEIAAIPVRLPDAEPERAATAIPGASAGAR